MPVVLSYEYDPCIVEKANESYGCQSGLNQVETEFEDLIVFRRVLWATKGAFRLIWRANFAGFENADDLVPEIDRQIYCLCISFFPTNILAWQTQGERLQP